MGLVRVTDTDVEERTFSISMCLVSIHQWLVHSLNCIHGAKGRIDVGEGRHYGCPSKSSLVVIVVLFKIYVKCVFGGTKIRGNARRIGRLGYI